MKHWIFDFDGTLVDTDGNFSKTLGYALAPYGIKVDRAYIEKIRHKHPHNLFEDELTEDQAQVAYQRLAEADKSIVTEAKVFPGVLAILETIKKAGGSISIWTGRDLRSTQLILRTHNILHEFEKIISGTCVAVNKPGHDGLLELKAHHKAEAHEMVMIGDHHHDIEPANSLGLTSVLARWKKQTVSLPKNIEPNYMFGSVDDFHSWVKLQLKFDLG